MSWGISAHGPTGRLDTYCGGPKKILRKNTPITEYFPEKTR